MDFNDTPEEAAYRTQVRKWLDANASRHLLKAESRETYLAAAKAWQAKKAAAGYAQITWPKEWGGPGGTPIQQVIFNTEEAKHPVPPNPFHIGLGMCLPTVMAFADEQTKLRFVGPALRGEEIWCQLFSEPSGGSDVAAVRTRAVRTANGADWIISGQKVWTTFAQYAAFGIVLVRTDPDLPKHKGLTMFWVDMSDPGIDVRPIHQMSGEAEFNEVFFTDVRVPDSQRLGPVNDGWRVALVTLMNERLAVGGERGPGWRRFLELARQTAHGSGYAIQDQAVRERLADWYVQAEGMRHLRARTLTALSRGHPPGPENSIGKLVAANQMQAMASEAVDVLDQFGVIIADNPAFQHAWLSSPGSRLAGGTDEILKNIIAERVLGLPGDVRLDKDAPFSQTR